MLLGFVCFVCISMTNTEMIMVMGNDDDVGNSADGSPSKTTFK